MITPDQAGTALDRTYCIAHQRGTTASAARKARVRLQRRRREQERRDDRTIEILWQTAAAARARKSVRAATSGAKVERTRGQTVLLALGAFHGLSSNTRIIDLKRRLRCDSCGQKGHVDISVVWASYSARRG